MTDSKASLHTLKYSPAQWNSPDLRYKRFFLLSLAAISLSACPVALPLGLGPEKAWASDWGEFIPADPSEMPGSSSEVSELPSVHIGSSEKINLLNAALGTQYLEQVPGANVEISSRDPQEILTAVESGDIDLAIIDRPLTGDEVDDGLIAVPIGGPLAYVYDGPEPSETAQPFLNFVKDPANQKRIQETVTSAQLDLQPEESTLSSVVEPTSKPQNSEPSVTESETVDPEAAALEAEVFDSEIAEVEIAEAETAELETEAETAEVQAAKPTTSNPSAPANPSDDIALLPSGETSAGSEVAPSKPFPWGWLALPLLGLPLLFWLRRSNNQSDSLEEALGDLQDSEPSSLNPPPSSVPASVNPETTEPEPPQTPAPIPTPVLSDPAFTALPSKPSVTDSTTDGNALDTATSSNSSATEQEDNRDITSNPEPLDNSNNSPTPIAELSDTDNIHRPETLDTEETSSHSSADTHPSEATLEVSELADVSPQTSDPAEPEIPPVPLPTFEALTDKPMEEEAINTTDAEGLAAENELGVNPWDDEESGTNNDVVSFMGTDESEAVIDSELDVNPDNEESGVDNNRTGATDADKSEAVIDSDLNVNPDEIAKPEANNLESEVEGNLDVNPDEISEISNNLASSTDADNSEAVISSDLDINPNETAKPETDNLESEIEDNLDVNSDGIAIPEADNLESEVNSEGTLNLAGLGAGAALIGLGAGTLIQNEAETPTSESEQPLNPLVPVQSITIEPRSSAVVVRWSMAEDQKTRLLATDTPQVKIYDATAINLDHHPAHSTESYPVSKDVFEGEQAQMILPVEKCDRDYLAELGYTDNSGQWVSLGRSLHTRVPSSPEALAAPPVSQLVSPTAPVFSPISNQADNDKPALIAPLSTGKSCHQQLTIHSQKHAYTLDQQQLSALQSTGNHIVLTPGCYILTLDADKTERNSSATVEPSIILWVYGGRFLNQQTRIETTSTWVTLSGYSDSLTLNVLDTTNVYALFLDTVPKMDSKRLTLLVLKD